MMPDPATSDRGSSDKAADAFRTISEVALALDTPAHVLRFWESRFPQVKPVKRTGGRRYYRPSDVALLGGIRRLLHDDGMTIRGVQKILREQGVRHVASLALPARTLPTAAPAEPPSEMPPEGAPQGPVPFGTPEDARLADPPIPVPGEDRTLPLFAAPAEDLSAVDAVSEKVGEKSAGAELPPVHSAETPDAVTPDAESPEIENAGIESDIAHFDTENATPDMREGGHALADVPTPASPNEADGADQALSMQQPDMAPAVFDDGPRLIDRPRHRFALRAGAAGPFLATHARLVALRDRRRAAAGAPGDGAS